MLSFTQAVKTCVVQKPVNFRDRAPRSEFWWFALATFLTGIVVSILSLIPVLGILLYLVYTVASFVMTLSASVRRLHDINRTGWWTALPYGCLVLGLVLAIVGVATSPDIYMIGVVISMLSMLCFIVLIVFYIMPGTVGANRFGPDPLAPLTAQGEAQTTQAAQTSTQAIPGADGDFTKFAK